MTRAILYSFVICALGAALEALFAGSGIKQRLASLRLPPYALPFWGWMVIGGLYYVSFFLILYRLFLLVPSPGRTVAFALVGVIMFVNALWNYFFFRSRNLFHAHLLGLPYGLIALSLFLLLLLRLDRMAAWCLLPYILYLSYGTLWGYRIWKLNPPERAKSTAFLAIFLISMAGLAGAQTLSPAEEAARDEALEKEEAKSRLSIYGWIETGFTGNPLVPATTRISAGFLTIGATSS